MATSETKHDRALRQKRILSSGPEEVDLSSIELGPRIAIEGVSPEIDDGRFAVKRSVGDVFTVEADIFGDGHDKIKAALLFRLETEGDWHEVPMHPLENDRWRGAFPLLENGRYLYSIVAWRDRFASWRDEIAKKHAAGQPVSLELIEGRKLAERVLSDGGRAAENVRHQLTDLVEALRNADGDDARLDLLMSDASLAVMSRAEMRSNFSAYPKELQVWVDRRRAVFSAWYELFPRSQSGDPSRHGTFDDVIRRLPYVREMGFDVLYLPPIHPIGRTNRKGRNNSLASTADDPGSPYAIGVERRRPRRNSSRAWDVRGFCAAGDGGPPGRGSRSRSTSPSSVRPTIPGSRNIPSGSTGDPTAPSNSPKIRPRNTRTSSTSISTARRFPRSGSRFATSFCSGSTKA